DGSGEHAYARLHQISTAVDLDTCAKCHGFVTRVDYAVEGKYELETDFNNQELAGDPTDVDDEGNLRATFNNVQKLATSFVSPTNGKSVNLVENLADFDATKTPPLLN